MKMMILIMAVVAAVVVGNTGELVLVDKGVKKFKVVVAEDAIPAAKFGAKEIEKYLLYRTVNVSPTALERSMAVTTSVAETVTVRIVEDSSLPPETFEIDVTQAGVTIRGARAQGVIWGCYEILKRWAGMRWLTPTDDGEYCVLKGNTITAPIGKIRSRPFLAYRVFWAEHDGDWLWSARNNLQSNYPERGFGAPGSQQDIRMQELGVYGMSRCQGHSLTPMMCGTEKSKDLFAKHPEYYCLVKGKRIFSGNEGYGPNPCTSNPEVLDRIASNILVELEHPHGNEFITAAKIGNDDSTQWCECPNCTVLDPKETADHPRARRADRYWWTVNEIAKRIWAKKPEAKLGGWAYQDFWYPPVKVKPDPRLTLMLSFNDQCWRHSAADPKCPINVKMREIYDAWKPFNMRCVVNRSEFACEGTPGGTFAPAERTLCRNIREFPLMGCTGDSICCRGPYPEELPWEKKNPWFYPPFNGKNYKFFAVWQSMYSFARQSWDPMRDFEAELEEANALYYGKGWEGGMKEFRALLTRLFYNVDGCLFWPHSNPIGACLDEPGSEVKLCTCLEKAIAAAKNDPDPRAFAHCERAKEIFGLTWLTERPKYVKLHKEYPVAAVEGAIKVDGALDEADWQSVRPVGDFALIGCNDKVDEGTETLVKAVYGKDTVYFGIECREIDTAEIKCGDKVDRDKWEGLGDHVEVHYSVKDFLPKVYLVAINSKAQMHDRVSFDSIGNGDETFRTNVKWATTVEKDRWFLELAVPYADLPGFKGDGDFLKVNVVRSRSGKNAKVHRKASSLCNGVVHNADSFMTFRCR